MSEPIFTSRLSADAPPSPALPPMPGSQASGWRVSRGRLPALLAAVTTTIALFSAVLLSFGHAAPSIWLAPSPEVMELAADCDRSPDRQTRERCRAQLPQHLAALRDAKPLRLAQR